MHDRAGLDDNRLTFAAKRRRELIALPSRNLFDRHVEPSRNNELTNAFAMMAAVATGSIRSVSCAVR